MKIKNIELLTPKLLKEVISARDVLVKIYKKVSKRAVKLGMNDKAKWIDLLILSMKQVSFK